MKTFKIKSIAIIAIVSITILNQGCKKQTDPILVNSNTKSVNNSLQTTNDLSGTWAYKDSIYFNGWELDLLRTGEYISTKTYLSCGIYIEHSEGNWLYINDTLEITDQSTGIKEKYFISTYTTDSILVNDQYGNTIVLQRQ